MIQLFLSRFSKDEGFIYIYVIPLEMGCQAHGILKRQVFRPLRNLSR
jgi:hypothetical protein